MSRVKHDLCWWSVFPEVTAENKVCSVNACLGSGLLVLMLVAAGNGSVVMWTALQAKLCLMSCFRYCLVCLC